MDIVEHFKRASDALLQSQLRRDTWCEEQFVQRGVFLSKSNAHQLWMKRWGHMGCIGGQQQQQQHRVHIANVVWCPDGETVSCVSGNTVFLYRGWRDMESDTPLMPCVSVQGGTTLSRLRWCGGNEFGAVSHSSPKLWLGHLTESSVMLEVRQCDNTTMTTLQETTFDPSGNVVFAGGRDGAIYSWDRRQSARVAPRRVPHPGAGGGITGLHCSSDGQLLVSTSLFGTLCIWDVRSTSSVKPLLKRSMASRDSSNGERAGSIVASDMQGCKVLLQYGDRQASVFDLISQTVRPVKFSVDSDAGLPGAALLAGSRYGCLSVGPWVKFVDTAMTQQQGRIFNIAFAAPLASIAGHPNGECMAYALTNGCLGFVGPVVVRSRDGDNKGENDDEDDDGGCGNGNDSVEIIDHDEAF